MEKKKTTAKRATSAADKEQDMAKVKLNALQQALGQIEKSFGRGAIMKLGDENVENVEVIPSTSPSA